VDGSVRQRILERTVLRKGKKCDEQGERGLTIKKGESAKGVTDKGKNDGGRLGRQKDQCGAVTVNGEVGRVRGRGYFHNLHFTERKTARGLELRRKVEKSSKKT